MGKPIDELNEYLPTQSQKRKHIFFAIPNLVTFSLVDTATKCFATSDSLAFFTNQFRAVIALVMVSCVVNVLDANDK